MGYSDTSSITTTKSKDVTDITINMTPNTPISDEGITGTVKVKDEVIEGEKVQMWSIIGQDNRIGFDDMVTKADGRFQFSNLLTGRYCIEVIYWDEGNVYNHRTENFTLNVKGQVQEIGLEQKEATSFRIQVTDGIKPLEGIQVNLRLKGPQGNVDTLYTTTDYNGIGGTGATATYPIGTEVTYTVTKIGYYNYTDTRILGSTGLNNVQIALQQKMH